MWRRPGSHRSTRHHLSGRLLLVLLAVTFIAIAIIGQVEQAARTMEAPIELLGADPQMGGHPAIDNGYDIQYRFEAGGRSYVGQASRPWSMESIRKAKVCYDPKDPHNNLLIRQSERCPKP